MSKFTAALAAVALASASLIGTTALAQISAAAAAPNPTVDDSIADLLADPDTAAIMEKHLPGISQHPALPQFQDMTLDQVMPYSQGAVTEEIIEAIDADIKALPAE
jgi:cytochrome c1